MLSMDSHFSSYQYLILVYICESSFEGFDYLVPKTICLNDSLLSMHVSLVLQAGFYCPL
jgi:hypothetical protein